VDRAIAADGVACLPPELKAPSDRPVIVPWGVYNRFHLRSATPNHSKQQRGE
jgi:hypothetical protein